MSSARGRGGHGAPRGGRGGVWVPAKRPRAVATRGGPLGDPDADALLVVPLPGSRRAKVFAFSAAATGGKGAGALLDIREMWPKEGLEYALPSKKGICLTLSQAEALFAARKEILAALRAGAGAPGGEAGGAERVVAEGEAAVEEGDGGGTDGGMAKKEKKRKT